MFFHSIAVTAKKGGPLYFGYGGYKGSNNVEGDSGNVAGSGVDESYANRLGNENGRYNNNADEESEKLTKTGGIGGFKYPAADFGSVGRERFIG
jgi:hypothetical protein